MITLDTSVVVRALVGDDPVQTPLAERALVEACRGAGAYLTLVVLAEVGWVLRAGYKWERRRVHARLARLIRTRGVFLEEPEVFARAVSRYAKGGPELGDLLISASASRAGALPLVTFDRRLAREPGVRLLGE